MAPSFIRRTATVWRGAVGLAAVLAVCTGCEMNVSSQEGTPRDPGEGGSTAAPSDSGPRQTAAQKRTHDKTFDDIKFDIEKGESFERSMLNEQVKQLFGERIRIRGYIFPTFRSKGIKQFVLVRDNQECCFGPGAALYDCIRVTLQDGAAIEYTRSPVAVEGVFKLEEQFIDPERTVGAVFHMEDAAVD